MVNLIKPNRGIIRRIQNRYDATLRAVFTGQSNAEKFFTDYSGAGKNAFEERAGLYYTSVGTVNGATGGSAIHPDAVQSWGSMLTTGLVRGTNYTTLTNAVTAAGWDFEDVDVVFVCIGETDSVAQERNYDGLGAPEITEEEAKDAYRAFIEYLHEDFPHAFIVQMPLIADTNSTEWTGWGRQRRVEFEVLQELSYLYPGPSAYNLSMQDDTHLDQAGYEQWGEMLADTIAFYQRKLPNENVLGPKIRNAFIDTDNNYMYVDVTLESGATTMQASEESGMVVDLNGVGTNTNNVSVVKPTRLRFGMPSLSPGDEVIIKYPWGTLRNTTRSNMPRDNGPVNIPMQPMFNYVCGELRATTGAASVSMTVTCVASTVRGSTGAAAVSFATEATATVVHYYQSTAAAAISFAVSASYQILGQFQGTAAATISFATAGTLERIAQTYEGTAAATISFSTTGEGALPAAPLDSIAGLSVCADVDASLSDSYSGSGQTWSNLITSPADGDPQAYYDWKLGTDAGGADSADPTFTTDYFQTDGGDRITWDGVNKGTTLRNMHRTDANATDWWMTMVFYLNDYENDHFFPFLNAYALGSDGIAFEVQANNLYFRQKGDSNASTWTLLADAFAANGWYVLQFTRQASTGTVKFWLNGTEYTGTLNYNTSTQDAWVHYMFYNSHKGTPENSSSGTRIRHWSMGDEYLSTAKASAIKAALETRHGTTYD